MRVYQLPHFSSVVRKQLRPVYIQRSRAALNGFTLIEVLVSLLVLLIGVLGVAGIQVLSLQTSRGAYFRSQAVLIGSEILDAMRANSGAASAYIGSYPNAGDSQRGSINAACEVSNIGCRPSDAAAHDLKEWSRHFRGVVSPGESPDSPRPTIPEARAVISRGGDGEYIVRVFWTERGYNKTEHAGGVASRVVVERSVFLRAVIGE